MQLNEKLEEIKKKMYMESYSLTVSAKSGLVDALSHGDLSNIIKPLVNEIYLFDIFVAGTTYHESKSILDSAKIGDKLSLQRENNKFDANAILVLNREEKKLGYIPSKDNIIFSSLMDAEKSLIAKTTI